MTIEDAIRIVKDAFEVWELSCKPSVLDWSEEHTARDMAIEALKKMAEKKEKACSNCQEFDCYGCKWAERRRKNDGMEGDCDYSG